VVIAMSAPSEPNVTLDDIKAMIDKFCGQGNKSLQDSRDVMNAVVDHCHWWLDLMELLDEV